MYKYLFGPVSSRRLGCSLGVDMVPAKTCSLNCIYCEGGNTDKLSNVRKEYIPAQELKAELDDFLSSGPNLDYITFSGAGEPMMNTAISDIIAHVKKNYPKYKLALLTNGTFLNDDEARASILACDLVIPSLDAVSETVFQRINRPCISIRAKDIIDGIRKLSLESSSSLWIEIFVIPGINDTPEEIKKFKEILHTIKADKIQLNTLDRPGAVDTVRAASFESLQNFAAQLKEFQVEILKKPSHKMLKRDVSTDLMQEIINIIKRRPSTLKDLSVGLSIGEKELEKYLHELESSDKITHQEEKRGVFYKLL